MDLHSLKNNRGAHKRKMRVGRGEASGKGKTCGRGHKGQMSRAGSGRREMFAGGQTPMHRQLPKRGFHNERKHVFMQVNVGSLNAFEDGSEVDIERLRAAGLANGVIQGVKILGMGDLQRKLTVRAQGFSAAAREKIEGAGGVCEVVKPLV